MKFPNKFMLLKGKWYIGKMFNPFKRAASFKINLFKLDRMIPEFIWKNNVARTDKSQEKGLTLPDINIY